MVIEDSSIAGLQQVFKGGDVFLIGMKHVLVLLVLMSVLVAGCAPVNPEFGEEFVEGDSNA